MIAHTPGHEAQDNPHGFPERYPPYVPDVPFEGPGSHPEGRVLSLEGCLLGSVTDRVSLLPCTKELGHRPFEQSVLSFTLSCQLSRPRLGQWSPTLKRRLCDRCPALDRFCETSRRGISCYMSNLATCRGPLVEQHRREHGVTFCSPNWFWTVLSMGSPFSRLPHLPRLPCNGAVGKWNACLSDDRIPIFRLSRSYRYSILSRAVDARTYPRQGAVRERIDQFSIASTSMCRPRSHRISRVCLTYPRC